MPRYIALVDGKPGAYGVVVPDLPGCTSGGKTVDAALRNAVEAVRLWAEDARAEGETMPRPRTIEVIRRDGEVASALAEGAVLAEGTMEQLRGRSEVVEVAILGLSASTSRSKSNRRSVTTLSGSCGTRQ